MNAALRAENLGKTYGDLRVLHAVTLELLPQERLGVLGPSGCGKTTLLRILLGVEPASEGAVKGSLNRAGYLPQGNLLLPWKTVLANVELPLVLKGVPKLVRKKKALELLQSVDLDAFATAYPFELSGGMQQRVALLRALIAEAPMLILDEPFGALDTMTRHRLQDWLLAFADTWDLAMLFVTHDLEEAVMLAQRVLVLSERPGTVAGELTVDLTDRTRHDRLSMEFQRAREDLMRLVSGGLHA